MIQTAIREAMGRQHVSLSRLARDAHVQRATIYAWFDGQRPEPDTWDRVATRLELPDLDTLLHQHAADPTDVVTAIHENTEVLRQVLKALSARWPDPDPTVAGRVVEVVQHGADVAVPKAEETLRQQRSTRPPRKPARGRAGDRRQERREAG